MFWICVRMHVSVYAMSDATKWCLVSSPALMAVIQQRPSVCYHGGEKHRPKEQLMITVCKTGNREICIKSPEKPRGKKNVALPFPSLFPGLAFKWPYSADRGNTIKRRKKNCDICTWPGKQSPLLVQSHYSSFIHKHILKSELS